MSISLSDSPPRLLAPQRPLARLLPECATAERLGDHPSDVTGPLHPDETAILGQATAFRRHELRVGRHLARAALAELGVPPTAITADTAGAPCWPTGVIGSITHCTDPAGRPYRAAAVTRASVVRGVGIDAEPHEAVDPGVLGLIAGPGEWTGLAGLAVRNRTIQWDRILFSAKESVYKAWYPITRQWLDFTDVNLRLDVDGSFVAMLPAWGPLVRGVDLSGCSGRWSVDHGLIRTSCLIGGSRR